jgi:hypothetical protein
MSINPTAVTLHIAAPTMKELLSAASDLCQGHAKLPEAKLQVLEIPTGPRFQVDGDVVLDRTTGLEWSRENVPGGRMNWAAAKEACATLTVGGHSDWRLPTIRELLTLVDYERHEPAIDTDAFKCESSYYWTSTPAHSSPGVYAWVVDFGGGSADWGGQDGDFCVRAVRASQSLDLWHVR